MAISYGTHLERFPEACTYQPPRPIVVTGALVALLREHFAHADSLLQPELVSRLWTPGDATNVLIEDALEWIPSRAQKRPAILVLRNTWRATKRLPGNRAGATAEGDVCFMGFFAGTHTIFCIGRTPAETEILGAEVYLYLLHWALIIRSVLGLLMFDMQEVGQISQLEEEEQHYVVPISVGYGWTEQWTIRDMAPIFKRYRETQDLTC